MRERAASAEHWDGKQAIHVGAGEFLCPMCKKLSNALVPKMHGTQAELSGREGLALIFLAEQGWGTHGEQEVSWRE